MDFPGFSGLSSIQLQAEICMIGPRSFWGLGFQGFGSARLGHHGQEMPAFARYSTGFRSPRAGYGDACFSTAAMGTS